MLRCRAAGNSHWYEPPKEREGEREREGGREGVRDS